DFILSDNSALCSCAKVLDVDCILATVSSSMASSPGLLENMCNFGSRLGILGDSINFVSCLYWKYPKNHSVHTGDVGSDKWILLVIILICAVRSACEDM
ncbi:45273_t:CDS:2, partial [Gigaspora margarita]